MSVYEPIAGGAFAQQRSCAVVSTDNDGLWRYGRKVYDKPAFPGIFSLASPTELSITKYLSATKHVKAIMFAPYKCGKGGKLQYALTVIVRFCPQLRECDALKALLSSASSTSPA